MTVYNTVNKLKRRKANELNGLNINTIQSSAVEKNTRIDVINKYTANDNYNIVTRLVKEYSYLEGLLYNTMSVSKVSKNTIVDVINKYNANDNYNKFIDYERSYNELDGLLVSVIELSKRNNGLSFKKIKITKPVKTYKYTLRIIKKYTNNIKY